MSTFQQKIQGTQKAKTHSLKRLNKEHYQSHGAQMLEVPNSEFKITMSNMLRALMKKIYNMR